MIQKIPYFLLLLRWYEVMQTNKISFSFDIL